MLERSDSIATADGQMPVYVCHPDRGRHPLIIIYMDAYGIRQELRDMALRLATSGYCVVLPNLYYRKAPGELGPIPEPDEFERLALLTECVQSLTISGVMSDTDALLRDAAAWPTASTDSIACVGYCMSGRFAVAAAARFPERVSAAASFYGTWLVSDDPESPHRSATKARGKVYFACAEHDHWAPLDVVTQLKHAVEAAGSNVEVEIYTGASHAFAFPSRRQYERLAAARHWERIIALLRQHVELP
jgi:carboxymethylenebutenolidase